MDISGDEDMFAISDDENIESSCIEPNPIEEELFSEMNDIQKRIDRTNVDLRVVQSFSEGILEGLVSRAKCGQELSCNVVEEWFTVSGDLEMNDTAKNIIVREQPLKLNNFRQFVDDDRWIIEVGLCNTSNWNLNDLRFYLCPKDESVFDGTSTFWALVDNFWYTVENIKPNTRLAAATIVLDIPLFNKGSSVEASGSIFYTAGDECYQLVIPDFCLSSDQVINGSCSFDFENDIEYSILAMKASSVDKTISFDMKLPGAAVKFLEFLRLYHFDEVNGDIRLAINLGSLKYCIMEILSITSSELKIRVAARSTSQLSVISALLRKEFAEIPNLEVKENLMRVANFLLDEIDLYMKEEEITKIQRVKNNCDFLLLDFLK